MPRRFLLLSVVVSAAFLNQPQALVRVGCVGTSITHIGNYTRPLAQLLGTGDTLGNFGTDGVTVVRDCGPWLGDPQYNPSDAITRLISWRPDICVVELGANDAQFWNHKGTCHNIWYNSVGFVQSYNDHLDSIVHNISPAPRMFLCLPTPQADTVRDSIIRDSIIPLIRQIAAARHYTIVDNNTPLRGHPEYFPDGLHPNSAGGQAMAQIIYQAISGATRAAGPGIALAPACRRDHIDGCSDMRGRAVRGTVARARHGLLLVGFQVNHK
jgi:lysophospholipase L1-like esterase